MSEDHSYDHSDWSPRELRGALGAAEWLYGPGGWIPMHFSWTVMATRFGMSPKSDL